MSLCYKITFNIKVRCYPANPRHIPSTLYHSRRMSSIGKYLLLGHSCRVSTIGKYL